MNEKNQYQLSPQVVGPAKMALCCGKNMTTMHRAVHACFGIVLVVLGASVLEGTIGAILVIFSAPLILTAISGFCPSYVSFEMGSKQKSAPNGRRHTRGNDQIISDGIESLWLMPRGAQNQANGHCPR